MTQMTIAQIKGLNSKVEEFGSTIGDLKRACCISSISIYFDGYQSKSATVDEINVCREALVAFHDARVTIILNVFKEFITPDELERLQGEVKEIIAASRQTETSKTPLPPIPRVMPPGGQT